MNTNNIKSRLEIVKYLASHASVLASSSQDKFSATLNVILDPIINELKENDADDVEKTGFHGDGSEVPVDLGYHDFNHGVESTERSISASCSLDLPGRMHACNRQQIQSFDDAFPTCKSVETSEGGLVQANNNDECFNNDGK